LLALGRKRSEFWARIMSVSLSRGLTVASAHDWPFLYPLVPELPAGAVAIHVPNIHEAFVNRQTAHTRLVTTNATYVLQEFLREIDERGDVTIVATADLDILQAHAPEAVAKRGPWATPLVTVTESRDPRPTAMSRLARAFRATDPAERLQLCIEQLNADRNAPTLLAAASAAMEVNDLDAAARDLEEAIALAPQWAAAHFEHGKLWLRRDDMQRASEAFARATTLLPTFTSAWANLGATLGELDRPEEALGAFETALSQDPSNPQAVNNVGVVRRELGRLDLSEAAFRRVIELEPERAFGYYNLGHTLFLQGRYQGALTAYVEGQRRDREKNPVQATRLALCRLATGDATGALIDLRQATTPLPREYQRQLLADTQAIAWALLTHRPDLPGWKEVSDWLSNQIAEPARNDRG
jgi:tetratricopeptide (TPR) repeat protein